MLQLREFDLELALAAAGTLTENIEDQFGAIKHTHLPQALKVALLDCRNFVIEEHELRAIGSQQSGNLVGLACADVKLRIGTRTMADQSGCHDMTGGLGQSAEFIKRRVVATLATQCDADQQCTGNGGF
jgi:hypothetical protein